MHLHDLMAAGVALLAVTAIALSLFHRLGLGSVLGFLAAGVLLGPSVTQIPAPVEEMREISELGVVLLLFVIGLEMQPKKLWSMRRLVFGMGTLQVLATGGAIALYLLWLDFQWNAALLIGMGLALSSTAFVLQMLTERGDMASEHGRAAFAVLLLQDIAIVPLLAVVPLLATLPDQSASDTPLWQTLLTFVGLFAALFVTGRYLVPLALSFLAGQRNVQAFNIVIGLAVIAAAWAMDLIGASEALGTFLMGMLLSASPYRHQIEATVEPFKGFLLGLFFISVGMSINLKLLLAQWVTITQDVVIIFAVKGAILLALGLIFGLSRAAAIRVAFLLPQCGEFGFVLLGAGLAVGVIAELEFAMAIVFISMTMVFTPVIAKLGDWLALRAARQPTVEAGTPLQQQNLDRHVVVAGYGRSGRIVSIMLERCGIPYLALDRDQRRVALGKKEGRQVFYGNLNDSRVLKAVGLGRAAGIVITLNDPQATKRLAQDLRNMHPELSIFARAHGIGTRDALLAAGVNDAVPELAEASLQLGANLLTRLGVADDDVAKLLFEFRRDGYEPIRPAGAED